MKLKRLSTIAVAMISAFGFMLTMNSCEKEPVRMELPPAESLVINWDAFPSNEKKSAEDELMMGNWFYSAASIVVWNTVVAANIVVPTVAYGAAFNHEPVYLGDETWEWSYSVTVNQRTIVARLVGARIDNETFSMEMYLSETNNFEEFKWFEGVIRYDHTAADWTLYHSPQNPVEYLQISYQKDFENDIKNIRYTVVDPGNELYEGYIDFGIDANLADFDAHYTISKPDTTTYIEWNTTTNAGRVLDQGHYNDNVWHCWDSMLQDVECPAEELTE
jgi:hypothetical protein